MNTPGKKKGFTLIELLVVIAIIAILAAILFPVFAQAREKARAITCISNLKQIGLGFLQYNQDYDEYTLNIDKGKYPSPKFSGTTYTPAWYILLDPYVKDVNLFYCPDRTGTAAFGTDNYYFPTTVNGVKQTGRMWGYGYNDGLVSDGGYGLIGGQVTANGGPESATNPYIRPGTSIARITSPAQMVAFGDTYDNLSIALDNIQGGGQPDSPGGTSAIRHNQLLNFCFVDGHAHTIRMIYATNSNIGGAPVLLPADQNVAQDWCYDPNAVGHYNSATPSNPYTGYPLSADEETCTQAVADLYAHSTYHP